MPQRLCLYPTSPKLSSINWKQHTNLQHVQKMQTIKNLIVFYVIAYNIDTMGISLEFSNLTHFVIINIIHETLIHLHSKKKKTSY
jgi:hypothetical protein